jgi:DNA anti-recombination protein RmuC
VEQEERAEKMMNDWCSEIDRNLQDVQSQNRFLIYFLKIIKYFLSVIYSRERVSDIMCQVSQFEEQLRDLQHLADTLQPAQAAFKEKLSSMQKNHDVQIAGFEENLESLRETNAEDNRKQKKSIEEKLFKITKDIGDFEIIERKIDVLEQRLKKLITRIDDSRYEAEVVQRLEISESGMLQKINYCSNQQVL